MLYTCIQFLAFTLSTTSYPGYVIHVFKASSCYFKTSHTMYALRVYITTQGLAYDARGNFLQASAGRLPVTNQRTSDHRPLGRLLVLNTAYTIAIASDPLTAQRFTIAAFATIGCHCFPHGETQNHFHDDPLTRRRLHDHQMDATQFPCPRKPHGTGFTSTARTAVL